MIYHLRGILTSIRPFEAVIECGGVGYHAILTSKGYEALVPHETEEVFLLAQEIQREDGRTLYGFVNEEEKTLFLLLTGRVSGVGPKGAIAVLSGMETEAFKAAVVESDIKTISKIKGVGPKTAERICLELRGKVGAVETWEAKAQGPSNEGPKHDTILALISLGYHRQAAQKAAQTTFDNLVKAGKPNPEPEDLLRGALQVLAT